MKPVVFLGPTLPADRAREIFPGCEVRPPVGQGDVLRALRAGTTRIGIVDGYFDQVPSVWHKEILFAMERGAVVLGSSSMGALRAAELHLFGMIGVGRIFELFRDGVLEDDDEVAVSHGSVESGYRPMSEAMVNIRDRIEAAVEAGAVRFEAGARLVTWAKALPYQQRSFKKVAAVARYAGLETGEVERFERFVNAPHASLKERDAVALLRRMASGEDRLPVQRPRVERTVFFERLRLQVEQEVGEATPAVPLPEGSLDAMRHALLGLLAEEHAELLAVPPTEEEIELTTYEICTSHGLLTPEAVAAWIESRGLTVARFQSGLRLLATIQKLQRLYGPEIARRVRDRLHLVAST